MNKENDFNHILLRRLRRDRDMTQAQLAVALNVKKNSVYNWERGKYAPNRRSINKLEELFDVPASTFSISAAEAIRKAQAKTDVAIGNWQTPIFTHLHQVAVFFDSLNDMPEVDDRDKYAIQLQMETIKKMLLRVINSD